MSDQKHKARIVDNPDVVETYANKLVITSFDGGALTVTLGVTRFLPDRIDDAPKPGQHPVVNVTTRFAISPAAAVELVTSLNQMLGVMANNPNPQKIVPVQPPGAQPH